MTPSTAQNHAAPSQGRKSTSPRDFFAQKKKRIAVFICLLGLIFSFGHLGELTRELITDAFVQVSSFVAATLLLFYGAERIFGFNIAQSLKNAKLAQVPLAALLGATPGCGGAVVVVAAYSSGHVTLGSVTATLTATMGDAAFLLIATRPDAAAVVLPLSFAVGILTGWIVDYFQPKPVLEAHAKDCELAPRIGRLRKRDILYLIPLVPGLIVGIAQLMSIEINAVLGVNISLYAVFGTIVGLSLWLISPIKAMANQQDNPITRATEETAFISVWVIAAYLAYDYLAAYAGLDLEALFASIAPLLPLIAILIGFIPGCGPQVLVTTLYINGLIPFAALLGNAVANDGDALFPAIALAPKAALLATIYSAIPAFIVSYATYFALPNLLN